MEIPYAKAVAKKNPSNEKTTEQHIDSLHRVKTPSEHSKVLVRITTKLYSYTWKPPNDALKIEEKGIS